MVILEDGTFHVAIGAQIFHVKPSQCELFTELQFVTESLYRDEGRTIAVSSGRSVVVRPCSQELIDGLVFGSQFVSKATPFGQPYQIAKLSDTKIAFCCDDKLVVSSPYFETSRNACSWQLPSRAVALGKEGCYFVLNSELVYMDYESDFVMGGIFRPMKPTHSTGIRDVVDVHQTEDAVLIRRVTPAGDFISLLQGTTHKTLFLIDRGVPCPPPQEKEKILVPKCMRPELRMDMPRKIAETISDLTDFLSGTRVQFQDKNATTELNIAEIRKATEALDKENQALVQQIKTRIAEKTAQALPPTEEQNKTARQLLEWLETLNKITAEEQKAGIRVGILEKMVKGLEGSRGRVYIEE